jgi:transketolase
MLGWLPSSLSPAYLRLTELPAPPTGGPDWEIGRARVVREGADVGLLAVGTMVARALAVAEELAKVGLSARVLDLASVKPIDLKSILRAARDTGALLTLEEHLLANGVGTQVAALTAENYPVPVRRLGIPDLAGPAGTGTSALDALGLSRERIVEETWELLRLKGKVQ